MILLLFVDRKSSYIGNNYWQQVKIKDFDVGFFYQSVYFHRGWCLLTLCQLDKMSTHTCCFCLLDMVAIQSAKAV